MKEEKTILENDRLLIEINAYGAELARIYDKKLNREVLWEADPAVWARHAPILFPFIGNCNEGTYLYNGVTYPMTAHGFARDSVFNLVSADESEVWYQLEDSEKSRGNYPFQFRLQVGHRLEGNRLTVLWKVENTDSKELLFMIGGHPAFRTPEESTVHDFTFEFDNKEELHYQAPDHRGYEDPALQGMLKLQNGRTPLSKGFFDKVLTYIFDNTQVKQASLLLPGEEPYVTVHCQGFPYLGVWTMEKTHPFVCLEPWFGRCAEVGFTGELKDRDGIISLGVGEGFQANYVIEIH